MRPLAYRLLFWLTISQVTTIVVGMLLFPLYTPYINYSQIAEATARSRLLAGLTLAGPAQIKFAPTAEWASYKERRSELVFALIDLGGGRSIAASDADTAAAALQIAPFAPQPDGSLVTSWRGRSDDSLVAITEVTPVGRILVVTAGNAFGWEDIGSFFTVFAPAMIPMLLPAFIGALIAVPMLVRRVLAPLEPLTALAQTIDASKSRQRLPDSGLDPAFVPLIRSINLALDRLDKGLEEQRLYAANAAHELRTPVAILRTRVDTLPAGPTKLDLQRDTQRIATLVEQLLSIARLGQQQLSLDETLDLAVLARDVAADMAPLALRGGKTLAFEGCSSPVLVKGNGTSISSAIANLIDNALRAEPEHGQVDVIVQPAGVVDVVDHGTGVQPADAGKVFEPFWRKNETPPGTGLGLAIVQAVMAQHGGTASVLPTCGGGATFRLTFPNSRCPARESDSRNVRAPEST